MRRALLAFLSLSALLAAAPVRAEFGPYGPDGWPIAADGTSTNPVPGMTAAELEQALAAGDPLNRVGDTTLYPYWPLLTAEVTRLANDHPDRVRLTSVGKSTLGLDLWMLEIADWGREGTDAFLPLEERESVWVDGGHHSNEYSGVYFALAWAQYLVEEYGQDPVATWIVENRHTWILPMVNPDGSHAFGRLNAHGVNLNRNYPVVWDGEGHDAFMNNRGPSPASEVETQVNIEALNFTRPDYYASIHCCGNLWLYPYGEEGVDPADQAMLQKVCDQAFPAVREDCGPIWSTIYPASGSSVDTAYEYTGTVAFGYEMSGRGAVSLWGQPVTFEAVRTQETESWEGLLHAFLNVHLYGAFANVTAVAADADGLLVTVRNEGLGDLPAGSLQLGMPSGEKVEAAIPPLPAGAETVVRVPCEEDGGHTLMVAWQKRLEPTSNVGQRSLPLTVLPAGSGAGPAADGAILVVRSEGSAQEAPGLAWAAPLALLGAALALRRRFA
jgi:hypothetical protein